MLYYLQFDNKHNYLPVLIKHLFIILFSDLFTFILSIVPLTGYYQKHTNNTSTGTTVYTVLHTIAAKLLNT